MMKTTQKFNTNVLRWAGSFALLAALVACGGGGGSGVPDPIPDPINNANAVDDSFPAIQSATGGSTTAVQINDTVTINGTTTAAVLGVNASITAVTRTSAAPAAGSITLNASTGVVTVAAGTSAGAYAFTYQLCRTALNQTVCDVANASGSVTATPPASDVVVRADVLACPASPSLISSSTWSSCLAGKRLVGNDPIFTSQTCQLRFLASGSVEFTHNGVIYVPSVNEPISRGLYQNTTSGVGVQQLLGNLNWNLSGPTTTNRVSQIDVRINLNGADLVEVEYFDSGLNRRNLNCSIGNI